MIFGGFVEWKKEKRSFAVCKDRSNWTAWVIRIIITNKKYACTDGRCANRRRVKRNVWRKI